MKKFVFSLLGALIGGFVCIGVAWSLGHFFGPLFHSEAESTRNFKIFLFSFLACLLAGLVAGYRLAGTKAGQG